MAKQNVEGLPPHSLQSAGQQKKEAEVKSFLAERKFVTVMFADISGFTSLSENMDPEYVRDMMNNCFEILVPIIEKYGGYVDKFIGDEIMALFGAPVTHEDDPARALNSALEMMENLFRFNQLQSLDLGLHFGINTGLVIAGGIGTESKMEYSVMGDTVNLASRLEDLSERGEILAGPDTYRLTRDYFDFKTLDPVKIKGKKEPVKVFLLLGAKNISKKPERIKNRHTSMPPVGRENELKSLNLLIEEMEKGRGNIISISGEAGIGKTRLINEVRKKKVNLLWLDGYGQPPGKGDSYFPFREILKKLANISEEDDNNTSLAKLMNLMSNNACIEKDNILPYMAAFLELKPDETHSEQVRYLDGEALKHQIFRSLYLFFMKMASHKPLVFMFEDFHNIDISSLTLLKHLIPLIKEHAISFCFLSRIVRGSLSEDLTIRLKDNYADRFNEMRLKSLNDSDSLRLIKSICKTCTIEETLSGKIIAIAEGNPFYIEEIVRSIEEMETGISEKGSGSILLWNDSKDLSIPDTVHGVIMARVDRLRNDEKEILKTASVIGRYFYKVILNQISEIDIDLNNHLVNLQNNEFIEERKRSVEPEFGFSHALVQEAVYESILRQRRQELHLKAAEAMERFFSERLEEFYGLLAFHYAQAKEWSKAREYLLLAGDRAGSIAGDSEALHNYRLAFTAYESTSGNKWDPLQKASLERKIGDAYFRTGEHSKALESFGKALEYLGKPMPGSQGELKVRIASEILKQAGNRVFSALSKEFGFREISEDTGEELNLYEKIGWIEAFGDNEKFLLVALKTLNVSERSGSSYGIAAGSMGIGTICNLTGFTSFADFYHRRAVKIAETTGNPAAMRLTYNGMSIHYMCLGNWEQALLYGGKALEVYRKTGDIHGTGYVSYMVAVALGYMGRFDKALEVCNEMIKLGREGADRQVECWGYATMGFVLRRNGMIEDAISSLKRAGILADETRDYTFRVWISHEMGECILDEGDIPKAINIFEENFEYYNRKWSISTIWLPYLNGMAAAYMKAAEDNWDNNKKVWLDKGEKTVKHLLKHGKYSGGVIPEAICLRGTLEWLRGNMHKAGKIWKESYKSAINKNQPYEEGLALMEMGRFCRDINAIEKAKTIFEKINADFLLKKANNYLSKERDGQ